MTTDMITFEYEGSQVAFDPAAKMWNLNAMHQASGSPKNKEPRQWLRGAQACELITALAARETVGNSHSISVLFETREGRNGCTWAHWQIAAAYAHYLRPDFYLQWNEWAMERAQQIADGEDAAPLARVAALEERVAVLERAQRRGAVHHLAVPPSFNLLDIIIITNDPTDMLTTTEISHALAARGIRSGYSQRGQLMLIAQLLRQLGCRPVSRRQTMQQYGGLHRAWAGLRLQRHDD